jgi:hypothetical protein
MLRGILIGSIIINTIALADVSLGVSISNGQERTSTIDNNNNKKPKKMIKSSNTFKKDDHRYDKRYRDFDYDRYGYYNSDGLYFGYFDRRGYFFNNIYFEYNSRYTYDDRLHRRGYFEPYRHHYRRYRYYHDNDWNRVHHYREPNEIVYGHYYEERYRPIDSRGGYVREEYIREERGRDYYRDGPPYYRDRDIEFFHDEFFRDDYRRGYRRDSRYEYRYRKPRDNAHVTYHRFSDKKDKKKNQTHTIKDGKSSNNHGRLQITR